VIHEDPRNADAHVHLAGIYRGGGLKSRAATMLRKALEIQPDYQPAIQLLMAAGQAQSQAPVAR
jgi:Tfp pilus assembly protein PilF